MFKGMCGGVRGVGAGGVVSTAFCLLYRLFKMGITRKQLVSLINHSEAPFIRGIGFLFIRLEHPLSYTTFPYSCNCTYIVMP